MTKEPNTVAGCFFMSPNTSFVIRNSSIADKSCCPDLPTVLKRPSMATPNYSFEKRKRELAKKAAKEAKRLRKAAKNAEAPATGDQEPAAPTGESAA